MVMLINRRIELIYVRVYLSIYLQLSITYHFNECSSGADALLSIRMFGYYVLRRILINLIVHFSHAVWSSDKTRASLSLDCITRTVLMVPSLPTALSVVVVMLRFQMTTVCTIKRVMRRLVYGFAVAHFTF